MHKRIVEQQQRLSRHVRRFPSAHRAGGLGRVEHHHHVVLRLALAVLIDAPTIVPRSGATAEIGRARISLHRLVELARHEEQAVADGLGPQPLQRHVGEQAVRGVGLNGTGRRHAHALVGLRSDDLADQLLERPALRDKPGGEMIEQFWMARLLAGDAEVVDGGDDAAAEEPAPDAVDQHAGGERIVGGGDLGGEQQPGRHIAGMACVAIEHLEIPAGSDVTGLRRLAPLLHGRIEAWTLRGHRGRSPELRDALFDLPILVDEQRNRVAQFMDVVAKDAAGKQPVEQVGLHGRGLALLPGIDRGHADGSPPGGDRLWRLGHAGLAASEQERQLQFVLRRLGAVMGDDAIDGEPGAARVV